MLLGEGPHHVKKYKIVSSAAAAQADTSQCARSAAASITRPSSVIAIHAGHLWAERRKNSDTVARRPRESCFIAPTGGPAREDVAARWMT